MIVPDGTKLFPAFKETEGPLPKTSMDWEIYPQGLHHFMTWVHENYTKGLPIMVTENGMASADIKQDGAVLDPARSDFIDAHLLEVKRAIDNGVPVKGYIIWSLLDNYEWTLGYDKRFGLVHVDFDTLERTPKQSWYALRNALKS